MGLLLAIVVHAADIQDRDGAKLVLTKLVGKFSRLKLIWADGGYAGKLIEWTRELGHWILQIVKRSDDVTGFRVLPKRWIVERTFAWFGRYRRLSKDYETLTESSEAMIHLAMIHLMLRRLRPRRIEVFIQVLSHIRHRVAFNLTRCDQRLTLTTCLEGQRSKGKVQSKGSHPPQAD